MNKKDCRKENINIRISKKAKTAIQAHAKGHNMSVADYILWRCFDLPLSSTEKIIEKKTTIDWQKAEEEDRLNSEMASSLSVALLKSSGNFE